MRAVEQQPAADAGAERQQHARAASARRPEARARRAAPRWRRCRPPPAARAARSSGRGTARRRSAGASTSATRRARASTSAGMPKPTASTSGAAARTSSTASTKMSSVSARSAPRQVRWTLWWTTRPSSTTPPRSFVPPRRYRLLAEAAWPDDIQRSVTDPNPAPPGVQGLPLAASARSARGGELDALRARLRPLPGSEPGASAAPARGRSPRPRAQVGRARRASAGCCSRSSCSWSAPRSRRACPTRPRRALSSGGSLLTGSTILVLGSDARTGDSIDESPASGPSRADTIMLMHADSAACASSRSRATPAEIPGHGSARSTPPTPSAGRPDDRDRRGFLGNGLKINHIVEVDFKDFPELIDSLGGITVNNKTRICSPPFDNFWKGLHFAQGRAPPNGEARARVRAGAQEPVHPGGGRPRPRRAPAGGAARRSARRPARPAPSSACPGSAGRRRRRSRPT